MKKFLVCLFSMCLLTQISSAQWVEEVVPLNAGWNGVYLPIEPEPDTLTQWQDPKSNVEMVFYWAGLLAYPSMGESESFIYKNAEWRGWFRESPTLNQLKFLSGNKCYLIYCSESTTLTIKGRPIVPDSLWVEAGFNLIGFQTLCPTIKDDDTPSYTQSPVMSTWFSAQSAIKLQMKDSVYLVHTPIGTKELRFSDVSQQQHSNLFMRRTLANWYKASSRSNFASPLEIWPKGYGLDFGVSTASLPVTFKNVIRASQQGVDQGEGEQQVSVTLEKSLPAPNNAPLLDLPLLYRESSDLLNVQWKTWAYGATKTFTISAREELVFYLAPDRQKMASGVLHADYGAVLWVKTSLGQESLLGVAAKSGTPLESNELL